MGIDKKDIEQLVAETGREPRAVIPILQAIQDRYHYLPEEALKEVCALTEITPAQIVGVASFYSQFRFREAGRHRIRVCVGTACHVKGSGQVYDALKRELRLEGEEDTTASGEFTIEEVNCLGCCTLAPVVQIDGITYGHVTTATAGNILEDFRNQRTGGKKRRFRVAGEGEIRGEIRVGLGSCCVASGSEEIRDTVRDIIDRKGLHVKLKHVGCVGMCHQVPLVEVVPSAGESSLYSRVEPADVEQIVERHFRPEGLWRRVSAGFLKAADRFRDDSREEGVDRYSLDIREKHVSSFLGRQVPMATEFRGIINPVDLDEYLERDGFKGLKRVLKDLSPAEVVREITESGIRGRGGAGFPTGEKWSRVAGQEGTPKYIICNGDEGDPGAFMDRMLLESYPYRIIEGITGAAYAVGATEGILYIRAEYPLAVRRVNEALEVCRDRNLLGKDILGSGFDFDLSVYQGAGAFVCGEETALIESIQGRRGFPRIRPPFPAEKGLWGRPTLVNNTETFAQVAYILKNGAGAFNRIGTDSSRGTKVFALAGKVARGGLIEVPMGITIREVVEEIGGGVAGDRSFKAVQIGGPSGGCVPHWKADTPVDFESLNEVGAMMGSGGMVVLDDADCMVDVARYFLTFTQSEACGKCSFGRIGTTRMLEILEKITAGEADREDLKKLEELAGWTRKGSLCGLCRTAPNPILSTLAYFRDEYEAHIEGRCPAGKCKALIRYKITDDCIGCTLCAQECPSDAIEFRPHELHEVDAERCIQCDGCRQVCPEDAVIVK